MKRGVLLCCFSLCLVMGTEIRVLKDIKDLKERTNFGKQFPRHGLMLLHWFASQTDINGNEEFLHFNPTRGHYGFHEYGSKQNSISKVLPELSAKLNRSYYVLGDLSNACQLPLYVKQDHYNSQRHPLRNIERVVIRLKKDHPETVDEVYITQHYEDREQGTEYDQDSTFRVSPFLLKQIQALMRSPMEDPRNRTDPRLSLIACDSLNYQERIEDLQSVYPPTPGLTWFLVLAGYKTDERVTHFSQSLFCLTNNRNRYAHDAMSTCDVHNKIKLEVKTTSKGYARISWSGIPEYILKKNSKAGLYKDHKLLQAYPLDGIMYGTIDTSWPLNPGFQVKLTVRDKIIWAGPKLNEANGVLPTNVRGYSARLQLYAKDGYACARLFVKKSCEKNWKTGIFSNTWVGFYRSKSDGNKAYKTYQWSTNFEKISDEDLSEEYVIFEYKSSLAIAPGVQLRFQQDEGYINEKARTEPWEDVINPDEQG
ncbi:uncharacterized protein LOC118817134 [Colossoma macropomum]|uniref:uncharacterized protein LOC118817134 n=1 Tax=Colossoma macropomum TaxID=42526 RepID=UPI0018645BA0|nr:uncharacterized protein LOC118817134 [Colossoma macropomum]